MDEILQSTLGKLTNYFLIRNYDYLWLRTMLEQAAATKTVGSTLITGSSHALYGIQENCWNNAFNCSMHSQDIFYNFQCAKRVLNAAEPGRFVRCIIIMGYYVPSQDLSLNKRNREIWISKVYYPIFRDAHHWENPSHMDLWDGIEISAPAESSVTPEFIKSVCEQAAIHKLLKYGTYFSELNPRGNYFGLKDPWEQVPQKIRLALGKERAEGHNLFIRYKNSFLENKSLFKDFIRFLHDRGVQPIVAVTPFTPEYNHFLQAELRAGMEELLGSVTEDFYFVDFNQVEGVFDPTDFTDTDHLGSTGAQKVSAILAETFGK